MNKYISVYDFAKKHNTTAQNVYRWIREGKIKDTKIQEVVTKRIRINEEELKNL